MIYRNKEIMLGRLGIVFLLLITATVAFGQYTGEPVKQDRLLQVLRSKGFQTRDIIQIINENGVDFKLTPMLQNELVSAGARPQVIEAVRNNYRYIKPAYTASVNAKNKSTFTGSPLSKALLITLLKNKTEDSVIKKQIKQSGVSFQMSQNIANEVNAAGGSKDLIKLLYESYNPNGTSDNYTNTATTVTKPAGNSYDDLLQQAIYAYDTKKDFSSTLTSLQQAVKLAPTKPRAYQLLGFLNLYGFKNFTEAEKNWRLAISYGGSAVLRVIHDHNGMFLNACQGSLYISKDRVSYEADDNSHTFETTDKNIKKIEVNNRFARLVQLKGGSFKIVLRDEDDGIKYNFAPISGNTDESKMIIRLVGKN